MKGRCDILVNQGEAKKGGKLCFALYLSFLHHWTLRHNVIYFNRINHDHIFADAITSTLYSLAWKQAPFVSFLKENKSHSAEVENRDVTSIQFTLRTSLSAILLPVLELFGTGLCTPYRNWSAVELVLLDIDTRKERKKKICQSQLASSIQIQNFPRKQLLQMSNSPNVLCKYCFIVDG